MIWLNIFTFDYGVENETFVYIEAEGHESIMGVDISKCIDFIPKVGYEVRFVREPETKVYLANKSKETIGIVAGESN